MRLNCIGLPKQAFAVISFKLNFALIYKNLY